MSNPIDGSTSGTRLRAIFLEPESGEPVFVGWHDTELDAECWFSRTEPDGRLRCVPVPPLSFLRATYLDAECTEQVHAVTAGCAAQEYALGSRAVPMCPTTESGAELLQIGERVEAAQVFERTLGGPCQPRDGSTLVLHRLTPVEPSRFVAAEVHEESAGRLVGTTLVAEDGTTQPYGPLRDTERGESCYPEGRDIRGLEPERLPCMPEGAARTFPGGASCDETWATYQISVSSCGSLPDLAYTGPDLCGSPTEIEVFRVGARVPEVFGVACEPGFSIEAYAVEPAPDAVPWLTRELRGVGRIRRAVWALDGVVGASALYDDELGVACRAAKTADGATRCLPFGNPLPSGAPNRFVDDACTRPGIEPGLCPGRVQWLTSSADSAAACAADGSAVESIYRVGEPAPQAYGFDDSGACVPSDDEVLELELVPLTSFVRLERRID